MAEITTDVLDRANAIRTRLSTQADQIRMNNELTTDAKAKRIAELFVRADEEMHTLRESHEGTNSRTATSVTRDVFGAASTAGADAISVRDADDRASRLELPSEAIALMERAEDNGDKVLSRAIAQHAYSNTKTPFGAEWVSVVQSFVNFHPEVAAKLERLEAATSQSHSASTMFAFVVPTPPEVDRLSRTYVAGLRAQASR